MKKALVVSLIAAAALGCEEEATCFHNCPDDPDQICGVVDMEPGQRARCEELANEKCAENPEHLDAFDGEVMFKLVTCSGNETCGLPDWCLPDNQDQ